VKKLRSTQERVPSVAGLPPTTPLRTTLALVGRVGAES
jgi:hypothetical protein